MAVGRRVAVQDVPCVREQLPADCGEEPFPIDDFEGKFSEDEEMMDSARDVMEDLEAIADQQIADRAADVANAAANP